MKQSQERNHSVTSWEPPPDWAAAIIPPLKCDSITRSSYARHEGLRSSDLRMVVPERRTCAKGVIPEAKGSERLLPSNGELAFMECSDAFHFVPRKRRVGPRVLDNRIFDSDYLGELSKADNERSEPASVSPDVSSLTGRFYTRRKYLNGPDPHLKVSSFDGGAHNGPAKPSKWCKA